MEEVSRLLNCIDNLKHRVLLKTIYSKGLRVGEAIRLKPEHIESDPSWMVMVSPSVILITLTARA